VSPASDQRGSSTTIKAGLVKRSEYNPRRLTCD
jgi:hypothetical protein